jgi:alpha-D-xyloside xylohydrolase
VAAISDSFGSPSAEAFRGFGGRHNSLDQRGEEFYNWLQQQNVSSGSLSGLTDPANGPSFLFPNGEHAAYYVQSSFVSPSRYGFLLDRDQISHWRLASDGPSAWQVEVAGPAIDYIVIPGGARRAVAGLSRINGRHRVPPRWAVGPHLDRAVPFIAEGPDAYAKAVRADLREVRRRRLPLAAYRIEGWQFLPRMVLRGLIRTMRARGIRPMLYFRTFVGRDDIGTDDPADFDEAVAKGYVAERADGSPYVFVTNFNEQGAMIDFTDPAAVRWWKGRIREALRLGAAGFMQDFGEQVQVDMHFHNGATGATMHNRLVNLAHRATRSAIRAFERTHPRRRIFFYTRAGHSGTPGAAAFESANFPGDETTDWTRSSGIASLATDMLNRAIGGAYGYTTDIGGYWDFPPHEATTRELFLRWTQWAALSPLFRLHGSILRGVHTPWSYDAATVRTYRRFTRLHLRARPLILRLWRVAARTGIPPTRPLWLQFPGDRRAARQDQAWMLGPDVLVAPVVTEGARSRDVYFPRGCWRSPASGRRFRGPRSRTVAAPLGRLPYFMRCGARPFARGG